MTTISTIPFDIAQLITQFLTIDEYLKFICCSSNIFDLLTRNKHHENIIWKNLLKNHFARKITLHTFPRSLTIKFPHSQRAISIPTPLHCDYIYRKTAYMLYSHNTK